MPPGCREGHCATFWQDCGRLQRPVAHKLVTPSHLPQALTQRDLRVAQGLRERLRGPAPHWAAELDAMLAAGRKADIEALPGALAPTLLEALRCAM